MVSTAPDLSVAAPATVRPRRARRLPRVGALTWACWGFLALVVLAAAFGWALPGYAPNTQNLSAARLGLFSTDAKGTFHLLGTDPLGVDTLSQLLLGARVSLTIAVGAVAISAVLGTLVGAAAGYFGGLVDRVVVVLVDLNLAVPRVLLMIPVVAVLGSSIPLLVLLLGLTGWIVFARVVRAQVLSLRERSYVDAAVMFGSTHWGILRRHLLPNVTGTVLVLASLDLGSVVVIESGLSYLGLGVQAPWTSWGLMIERAQEEMLTDARMMLVPSTALALLVLAINIGTRPFTGESGRSGTRVPTSTTGA